MTRTSINRDATVAELIAALQAMPQNKIVEIEIDTDLRDNEGFRVRTAGDVVVISYFPEDDINGLTGRGWK